MGIYKGETRRQQIIEILKYLGYDGYFNYEINEEMLQELHKYGMYAYTDLYTHSPSIAMFYPNMLLLLEKIPIEQYIDIEKERSFVHMKALQAFAKNNFDKEYFIDTIWSQTFCITDTEIEAIVDSITIQDVKEEKQNIKNLIEQYKKRFSQNRFL